MNAVYLDLFWNLVNHFHIPIKSFRGLAFKRRLNWKNIEMTLISAFIWESERKQMSNTSGIELKDDFDTQYKHYCSLNGTRLCWGHTEEYH